MLVRLPKPFWVAVSTLWFSSSATSSAITCWPSSKFIPRTPRPSRPMGRTSFSSKRTALPESEKSITSCAPSVMAAPIKKSPSSKPTAIMPRFMGRENASSGVFLTVPMLVAIKTYLSATNCFTGMTTLIFSPSSSGNKFTIGLPRLARPPCGTSQTLIQYTRPRLLKHKMVSWVLATNKLSIQSSSLVALACLPRPPRFWARYSLNAWLLM